MTLLTEGNWSCDANFRQKEQVVFVVNYSLLVYFNCIFFKCLHSLYIMENLKSRETVEFTFFGPDDKTQPVAQREDILLTLNVTFTQHFFPFATVLIKQKCHRAVKKKTGSKNTALCFTTPHCCVLCFAF